MKDCLNPVGSTHLRQLDTSNGCQDHTVLPYASALFVLRALIAHRLEPALRPASARNAAASTATRPNVRDDGQRPSTGTGWGRCRGDLGGASSKISENQKFYCFWPERMHVGPADLGLAIVVPRA
jgi:hypothetical protein